jgi:hypothetical protein
MIIFITKSITPSYCLFWLILGAVFKAPAWKWERRRGIMRRAMVTPVHWPGTCTGPSHWACTHVQNSRMPPARLHLQLTRAGPSHHEPRYTQLELALGAMHMARPGARRASHARAGLRCQPAAVPMRHGQGSSQGRTTPQPRGNRTNFNQAGWSHPRFCVYRHGACSENDLNANENERACPTRKKRIDEDDR